jgi:hypothetical protein
MIEKAPSSSFWAPASTILSSNLSGSAARFAFLTIAGCPGFVGFERTATRIARGAATFKTSRFLPISSGVRRDSPVMLPPGRARVATRPLSTGSATFSA